MNSELPKSYDPSQAQQEWLPFWEEKGYFHSEVDPARKPYTIVIPPPNVTGALHMGHALNNTLQDVLIRWRRMQGYNCLWMPGTDHAGIATQSVVERRIKTEEGKSRHELGRDELVKRIWAWKDQYEKRILDQLREMGASCDWARTRFTLDPICASAVRETFFKMFQDGYIYRGKRLVNWDTSLQTSVADDETYTENTKSGFWTFKYEVNEEPGTFISFSTTRPETMLGDSALCVHPDDERYRHLIGKHVLQPLVQRKIPIIADAQLADPTLGTGCVKVTPAHDPNDYECWKRNPQIEVINILNPDGSINASGGKYVGLDRYKAREQITADMEALNLFEGKEERVVPLKYSDRSKTPIEPYLSDQWFVLMGDHPDGKPSLAGLAMNAVESGQVKFFPERYARTYLDWLSEKRDWCISRQLWWGHRIPVWSKLLDEGVQFEGHEESQRTFTSGTIGKLFGPSAAFKETELNQWATTQVIPDEATGRWRAMICLKPGNDVLEKRLEAAGFTQDPDVLDTWFSSALWPHSTLGWPEETSELKYYYPTSTLVTSRDIITLWVARMVLAGLYNLNQVPFRHVYITTKVLDGFGEGMSKSKGNGVDPLDIISLYGADALRFGMVNLATETQDSRMPVTNICPHCGSAVPVKLEHMYMRTKKLACPQCKQPFRPGGPWPTDDAELKTAKQGAERFEIGRNFANKLWNATRFILMNLDGFQPEPLDLEQLTIEDRWILSRLATVTADTTAALEAYRFAEVARLIYDFSWSEFCDWYIEISKGRLNSPESRASVQAVLLCVLDGIIRLIQPIMPFIAESLWQVLRERVPERGLPAPTRSVESVCIAKWPEYPANWKNADVEMRFVRLQELVRSIREVRNRYQVEPKVKLDVAIKAPATIAQDFSSMTVFIQHLAGVGTLTASESASKGKQASTIVRPEFEAYVSLQGLIDPALEVQRMAKQIDDLTKQLKGVTSKLENPSFVANAPEEVVNESRKKVAELEMQIGILRMNQQDLQEA